MKTTASAHCPPWAKPLPAFIAAVVVLAGCTAQPAMLQNHVALLKQGELQINVLPHDVMVVSRHSLGTDAAIGALAGLFAGAVGGAIAGAAMGGATDKQELRSNAALAPYAGTVAALPLTQDFARLGQDVVAAVPWLKNGTGLTLTEKDRGLSEGQMRRQAQKARVDAVAFVQPIIAFSSDLKWVTIYAKVRVYARGFHHAYFLDGWIVKAGTALGKSGTPLSDIPIDKLAKSHDNESKNFSARAKLWFENDGYRFKNAVRMDMALLAKRLKNYFMGHR